MVMNRAIHLEDIEDEVLQDEMEFQLHSGNTFNVSLLRLLYFIHKDLKSISNELEFKFRDRKLPEGDLDATRPEPKDRDIWTSTY